MTTGQAISLDLWQAKDQYGAAQYSRKGRPNYRSERGHARLRPGVRLLLADALHSDAYAATLREAGAQHVAVRPLGWRVWFGGPWLACLW